MVVNKFSHEGHTLEIQTERVDVTPMMEPDPNWTFTDAAGHEHSYTASDHAGHYPTLAYLPHHGHADDEDECDYDDDQHLCYPVLACTECSEEIRPVLRPGRPASIPGLTSYLIDGQPVSKQAADDFMAAARAEQAAAGDYTQRIITESVQRQGLFAWLSKVVGKDAAKQLIRDAWWALDGGVVGYVATPPGGEPLTFTPGDVKIVRTWDGS